MSKLIGIISAISGLAGFAFAALIFALAFAAGMGGHNNAGSGLVTLQFWGAILSMAGIALGIIAIMLSKGERNAARKGGKMGLACGIVGATALFIGLQIL